MTTKPCDKTSGIGVAPALSHAAQSAYRNRHTPWIVLVLGLTITAIATLYMKFSVETTAEQEFVFQCNEIQNIISNRLDDHERILWSGAALFNASDSVTRGEWRIFNKQQKIEKQLPGIQGIGFSLLIPHTELARHIREIRNEGFPDYTIRPDGDREIYSSIIYLEPFSGRNLRSFGYDMLSEGVRRAAMERARDTDSATLSGKVVLVQETDEDIQPGTLMYVPVYRKDMPTDSIEQRRAAIYGWVYSPYRMNDLIEGIFGSRNIEKEDIRLKIFDGDQHSPQNLLYENPRTENARPDSDVRFSQQIPINFNGRHWTLCFTKSGTGFFTEEYTKAWLTLVGGMFITLLLFSLIQILLNTRAEAQRMAETLTVDLRTSEEKYRQLIENSHDIIYTITADGVLTFVSPAWTALLGDQVAQVVGQSFRQFVHPDDLPRCMAFLKKVIETGQRQKGVEYRVRHINGSWYWHTSSAVPLKDGAGKTIGFTGIAHDITERKKAEQELKQISARLALATRAGGVGIWDYDIVNNRLVWDDQMFHLYGITREQFSGAYEAWTAGIHLEDRQRGDEEIKMAIRGEKEFDTEFRVLWPDGTTHHIRALASVQRNSGQAVRMIGTNWDITAQKRLEEEKEKLEEQNRQLQKTESLSRMSGAIAHIFNNQLQVVLGYLEMVIDGLPADDSNAAKLEKAMKAGKKAAEVSGSLLAYLGQKQVKLELLDLSEICRMSLPLILGGKPKNVAVETDLPSPGPGIRADAKQIQQILTNIVINAWESVGDGEGAIRLSVSTVPHTDIPASHRFPIGWHSQEQHYACIEVTDSGCGMQEKTMNEIFDPFFSTKFTGRGLGLSVVLGIVKTHGAVITVENRSGGGSVFRVFFPLSAQIAPSRTEQAAKAPKIVQGCTVLLAEDNEALREMVRSALVGMGIAVLQARDGVEAVEIFKSHKDEVSCLICDLTMPRMDGWGTISALRAIRRDLPVILASGYDEASAMAGEHPELPDFFLTKPYDLYKLKDMIGQAMERRGRISGQ